MAVTTLPKNAREVLQLGRGERLLYGSVIAFHRLTGRWDYPMRTCGDLERMTTLDKIYWVHKAERPIQRARPGAGLEAFFAAQRSLSIELPDQFRPTTTVTLSAAGDLMRHPFLGASSKVLYRDVEDELFSVDVSMANLECNVMTSGSALSMRSTEGPALSFSPEEFEVVTGSGSRPFSFLATACNHSLDFGQDGVASTITALRNSRIAFHGTNESEEDARRCVVVDRRGIKIGIIAWTFGLNARRPPADSAWIVNRTNLNDVVDAVDFVGITHQVEAARGSGVDFVVAHLHWGLEHEMYPTPEQRGVAQRLAEIGVDLIIGHHPHVLQPVEYYRTNRDPDRVVPIYYSLGNLTNPFSAAHACRSGVAQVTVAKGVCRGDHIKTYVAQAGCTLVDQRADADTGTLRIVRAPAVPQL